MLATRSATVRDSALITSHREAMFREMGRCKDASLSTMSRNFAPWVEQRLASGIYLGWIAEVEGRPVASAGLFLMDWPPHYLDGGATRGYLLNVYVEPPYRGRGMAKALARIAMGECRQRNIQMLTLHASDAGRPVYESLGFIAGNEMQLHIPKP